MKITVPAFTFCLAMLLLAPGNAAAAGKYQRARDGRTLVWNPNPEKGEAASWSGRRDKDGYATGEGKLTWYAAANRGKETGTNITAARRYEVTGEYVGKMEHGQLRQEGDALADVSKKKPATAKQSAKPEIASKQSVSGAPPRASLKKITTSATPKAKESPAAAPTQMTKTEKPREDVPAEGPNDVKVEVTPRPTPPAAASGGLNSLMRPPSALRQDKDEAPSPSPTPE